MEENKDKKGLEEGKDNAKEENMKGSMASGENKEGQTGEDVEEKDGWGMDEEDAEKEVDEKTKTQNMMAAIIVLAGLFVGSLYVDVAQLVRGEGVSLRKLENVDVFTASGKTWISSKDPIVTATIINDDECEKCDVEPVIAAIKKTAIPTLTTKKVDANSEEGKRLLEEHGLKAVPAFLFDTKLKDTEFYSQAEQIFKEDNGVLVLDNAMAGVPLGKYIELPAFESAAAAMGPEEAELAVIIFGDFQCPYSKAFHDTFQKVYPGYQDRVKVSFHQFPLTSIHPQATNAALASLCANEQGKFWEMQTALFDGQKDWGAAKSGDKSVFETYARNLKIDVNQFKQCLNDEKYKDAIEKDQGITEEFQLSGTPSVFLGSQFINGSVSEEQLKEMFEEELKK